MALKKAIDRIVEETGLSRNEVESTMYQWATPLMQNGIIVNLEIRRWRGMKRITPEELGIDEADERWKNFKDYFFLGNRNLLPKRVNNKINAIENRARKNLKEHSFPTVWGYFVPSKFFTEWKNKNEEIRKEYFELADSLEDEFCSIKNEVLEDYKLYCRKIWDDKAVLLSGWPSYNDYERYFISKIDSEIINANEFRKSFYFNSFFYFIPMPSQIEDDLLQAELKKNEAELSKHEKEVKKEMIDHMVSLRQECLESFLNSTVGKIRETILNIVDEVRTNLSKDPTYSMKSGNNRRKLLSMINEVKKLDFYNDRKIQEAMDRLHKDLNREKSVRSDREIDNTLREIEDLASLDFTDLIYERFNLVEI